MALLEFKKEGIYCAQAGVFIDPWLPVDKAIITHGHSDHARRGMNHYLCHTDSETVLKWRIAPDISIETLDYGTKINMNGVEISLHPAGHIIGSAQVRLAYDNETWVVSGDYKLNNDGLSVPFEAVKCSHFITESTFGLPIYDFKSCSIIYQEINEWVHKNQSDGLNSVIIGYSLGKAQNILKHLDVDGDSVFFHGAIDNINQALLQKGYSFIGERLTRETSKDRLKNAVIVAPNSVIGTPWLRKLKPYKIAVCSGWMTLRGARRRYGVDHGFALSDHCDFKQLNEAIDATGAENIFVTHGYQNLYTRWLKEHMHLNAKAVKTFYEVQNEEEPEEEI